MQWHVDTKKTLARSPNVKWLDKSISSSKARSHKNLTNLLCLYPLVPLSRCQKTLAIFHLHLPGSFKPGFCHILSEILFESPKVNHKLREVAASQQWNIWEAPLTKSHCDTFINPLKLIENAWWVEETRGKKSSLSPGSDLQDCAALGNKIKISQTCKHFSVNCWSHRFHFFHFLWAVRRKQAGHHHVTTEQKVLCLGHWPTEQVTYTVLWKGTFQDAQYFIEQVFPPVI